MTPLGMLSSSASPQSPSNHSNIISSGSLSANAENANASQEVSPADSAISEIGALIQNLNSISSSYPGVGESEKEVAMSALAKYMDKVVSSLNSSMGGGESPIPTGY